MKTFKLFIAAFLMIFGTIANAQESVLVGPINTYKVHAHPSTAAKLVRMELIKTDKFNVLDEFDMYEVQDPEAYDSCYSKKCLEEYGRELGADIVISGSIDKIGAKIIVTLKMINVSTKQVMKTVSDQFDDQEEELQRMLGIMVQKLVGIEPDAELQRQLMFRNEMITSNNMGRINNSGPRMGVAITHGTVEEFLTRSSDQGGLEMAPVMSNLGYQFEVQYVGTENFSALFEFIPMLNGLEQGKFLPSISIMNGFRFGKAGWEFAFGPAFGMKKVSQGFFDKDALFGSDYGHYFRESEVSESKSEIEANDGYFVEQQLDNRGDWKLSTRWVMGFGRTFRSGALNIPVNVFYSSSRGGGMAGVSVGFNITRSKKSINK